MLAHVGALSPKAKVEAGKSDTCGAQPPPTSWPLGWSTPSRRQIRTELVSLPLFPSHCKQSRPLGWIVRAESGEMCELLHTSPVVQKMMGSQSSATARGWSLFSALFAVLMYALRRGTEATFC